MLYTVVLLKNVSGLLSLKCSFCSKSNIKKKKTHNNHGAEMRFLSQSPAHMFVMWSQERLWIEQIRSWTFVPSAQHSSCPTSLSAFPRTFLALSRLQMFAHCVPLTSDAFFEYLHLHESHRHPHPAENGLFLMTSQTHPGQKRSKIQFSSCPHWTLTEHLFFL